MRNFEFREIRSLIAESRLTVVTSHYNPDGDAIGSVLALAALLKKSGNKAITIVPSDFPSFLKWMPGAENIMIYSDNEQLANQLIASADLIFCVDYNALHRTERMEEPLRRSAAKKILIDHHPEPVLSDFDLYFSVVETSSTSEMIYLFTENGGFIELLDKEIATGLFVGIMTDTGSFSFSCNYTDTFRIAAELIKTGLDAEQIHRFVYDTYSENRLRLLGYCLSEKLTILPEYATGYIALTLAELDRFGHKTGDTEGIVNYALSIDKIKMAVLITERNDRVRLSFRSKGNLSVNRFAREFFDGGGHKNAAGGDSFCSVEDTVLKLKEALAQYKGEIDRSTY